MSLDIIISKLILFNPLASMFASCPWVYTWNANHATIKLFFDKMFAHFNMFSSIMLYRVVSYMLIAIFLSRCWLFLSQTYDQTINVWILLLLLLLCKIPKSMQIVFVIWNLTFWRKRQCDDDFDLEQLLFQFSRHQFQVWKGWKNLVV